MNLEVVDVGTENAAGGLLTKRIVEAGCLMLVMSINAIATVHCVPHENGLKKRQVPKEIVQIVTPTTGEKICRFSTK